MVAKIAHTLRVLLPGFPGSSVSKESACNAEDSSLMAGWGRSPGEGNGKSLLYPCLENPIGRGAWQAADHGVAESGMTERLTYIPVKGDDDFL